MKKLILIPTALITSLTPVISLVGCNKDNEPKLIVHTDDDIFFTAMGWRDTILPKYYWDGHYDTTQYDCIIESVKQNGLDVPYSEDPDMDGWHFEEKGISGATSVFSVTQKYAKGNIEITCHLEEQEP